MKAQIIDAKTLTSTPIHTPEELQDNTHNLDCYFQQIDGDTTTYYLPTGKYSENRQVIIATPENVHDFNTIHNILYGQNKNTFQSEYFGTISPNAEGGLDFLLDIVQRDFQPVTHKWAELIHWDIESSEKPGYDGKKVEITYTHTTPEQPGMLTATIGNDRYFCPARDNCDMFVALDFLNQYAKSPCFPHYEFTHIKDETAKRYDDLIENNIKMIPKTKKIGKKKR